MKTRTALSLAVCDRASGIDANGLSLAEASILVAQELGIASEFEFEFGAHQDGMSPALSVITEESTIVVGSPSPGSLSGRSPDRGLGRTRDSPHGAVRTGLTGEPLSPRRPYGLNTRGGQPERAHRSARGENSPPMETRVLNNGLTMLSPPTSRPTTQMQVQEQEQQGGYHSYGQVRLTTGASGAARVQEWPGTGDQGAVNPEEAQAVVNGFLQRQQRFLENKELKLQSERAAELERRADALRRASEAEAVAQAPRNGVLSHKAQEFASRMTQHELRKAQALSRRRALEAQREERQLLDRPRIPKKSVELASRVSPGSRQRRLLMGRRDEGLAVTEAVSSASAALRSGHVVLSQTAEHIVAKMEEDIAARNENLRLLQDHRFQIEKTNMPFQPFVSKDRNPQSGKKLMNSLHRTKGRRRTALRSDDDTDDAEVAELSEKDRQLLDDIALCRRGFQTKMSRMSGGIAFDVESMFERLDSLGTHYDGADGVITEPDFVEFVVKLNLRSKVLNHGSNKNGSGPMIERGRADLKRIRSVFRRISSGDGEIGLKEFDAFINGSQKYATLEQHKHPSVSCKSRLRAEKQRPKTTRLAGTAPVPPPEMSEQSIKLIQHSAEWIAKHGPDFEKVVQSQNQGKPGWEFLEQGSSSAAKEFYLESLRYHREVFKSEAMKAAAGIADSLNAVTHHASQSAVERVVLGAEYASADAGEAAAKRVREAAVWVQQEAEREERARPVADSARAELLDLRSKSLQLSAIQGAAMLTPNGMSMETPWGEEGERRGGGGLGHLALEISGKIDASFGSNNAVSLGQLDSLLHDVASSYSGEEVNTDAAYAAMHASIAASTQAAHGLTLEPEFEAAPTAVIGQRLSQRVEDIAASKTEAKSARLAAEAAEVKQMREAAIRAGQAAQAKLAGALAAEEERALALHAEEEELDREEAELAREEAAAAAAYETNAPPMDPSPRVEFSVECPQGVSAGQSVLISTANGDEMEVVVPDGVQPGESFLVAASNSEVKPTL